MNQLSFLILCLLSVYIAKIGSVKVRCVFNNDNQNYTIRNLSNTIQETCPDSTSFSLREPPRTISKNFVSDMDQLKWIDLGDLNLETTEPESFKNLPRLEIIRLENNKLSTIKKGTFKDLPSLETLILSDNSISVLEVGAFTNLPKMGLLNLQYNKLTEIKRGVFENLTLVRLDLNHNQIINIEPGVLAEISRYKQAPMRLRLEFNNFQQINPEIFNNANLTALELSYNSISSLHPGDLANLPELTTLKLSGNKIKEVPEGVFNSTKLVVLDLSRNEISTIASGAFNNMADLEKIFLDFNKLTIWNSNWFHGCTQLKKISFSHNRIEELPADAFKNFNQKMFFNFESNDIKKILKGAFKGINITRLILKGNKLEEWSGDLEDVRVTELLDLKGNKIPCPENVNSTRYKNILIDCPRLSH